MITDVELQLDQKIGLCFFDMEKSQILGESAEVQLTKRKSEREKLIDSVATTSVLEQNLRSQSEVESTQNLMMNQIVAKFH